VIHLGLDEACQALHRWSLTLVCPFAELKDDFRTVTELKLTDGDTGSKDTAVVGFRDVLLSFIR
jgi:hypothetical protein